MLTEAGVAGALKLDADASRRSSASFSALRCKHVALGEADHLESRSLARAAHLIAFNSSANCTDCVRRRRSTKRKRRRRASGVARAHHRRQSVAQRELARKGDKLSGVVGAQSRAALPALAQSNRRSPRLQRKRTTAHWRMTVDCRANRRTGDARRIVRRRRTRASRRRRRRHAQIVLTVRALGLDQRTQRASLLRQRE